MIGRALPLCNIALRLRKWRVANCRAATAADRLPGCGPNDEVVSRETIGAGA